MKSFCPFRRFLGLPAIIWVILPLLLIMFAGNLSSIWPPRNIEEPPDRAAIFRVVVLITRDGDSFRFVALDNHKGVVPLWAVSVVVKADTHINWETHSGLPGMFRRIGHWSYGLTTVPFGNEWKPDEANPFSLPANDLVKLRPRIIAELNRRSEDKLGDQLANLLDRGIDAESDVCPQNVVVLASWLSLLLAGFALISMFLPRRCTVPPAGD